MHNSGEKIYTMQTRKSPAVVAMPLRHHARAAAGVITMHPRTMKLSNVVTLVAGSGSSSFRAPMKPSVIRSGVNALSSGVRMTLVALFALLGWPSPSRDNDPGPSAARPCHWELTNLISHLPLFANEPKSAAARSNVLEFHCADSAMEDKALAA